MIYFKGLLSFVYILVFLSLKPEFDYRVPDCGDVKQFWVVATPRGGTIMIYSVADNLS